MRFCEMNEKIGGREFDWFAYDEEGNVAVFKSAGGGVAPREVVRDYETYDEATEELERFHSALEPDSAYARNGCFVYDWVQNDGPYRLIELPTNPQTEKLHEIIYPIRSIPVCSKAFSEEKLFWDMKDFQKTA